MHRNSHPRTPMRQSDAGPVCLAGRVGGGLKFKACRKDVRTDVVGPALQISLGCPGDSSSGDRSGT
jgi:hypothetical protein